MATWRIARAPSPITDADIERVRRATRLPSQQDIEAARRKHGVASGLLDSQDPRERPGTAPPRFASRSAWAAAQSAPPSAPQTVHIEGLPAPIAKVPIDLEAVAQGYAPLADAVAALGNRSSPALLVFVTLSMPQPTLARLVDQCARARATLVLRGLANGSLRETAALVAPLLGNKQVNLQIDPQAFDRFAITRVPAFVLVRDGARPDACARGSCPPPTDFVRVAGDVSLDYALAHMQRTQPTFRRDAEAFLTRLNLHSSTGHSPGHSPGQSPVLSPALSHGGGDHSSGDPHSSDRHRGIHDVATDPATGLMASSGPGAGAQD